MQTQRKIRKVVVSLVAGRLMSCDVGVVKWHIAEADAFVAGESVEQHEDPEPVHAIRMIVGERGEPWWK